MGRPSYNGHYGPYQKDWDDDDDDILEAWKRREGMTDLEKRLADLGSKPPRGRNDSDRGPKEKRYSW